MEKIKIACVGARHTHYQGFSEYVIESPYADLAGVYDKDPVKAHAWAEAVGVKAFDSYEEILKDSTIKGIICSAAPSEHEEYIIAAAKAGKNVITEIPLTTSNEAAYRIRDAVKESGIHFVLSNPIKHAPQMFAKRMADSGLLGEILQIRVRNVHDNSILYKNGKFPEFGYVYDKSLTGGGALNNVGYHGIAILHWFLGMPESAFGMFTSVTDAAVKNDIDENTVVVYKFPNKALGIVETGWVHPRFQGGFEIHGTNGSVVVGADKVVRYRLNGDKDWTVAQEKLMPTGIQHSIGYWIEKVYFDEPIEEYDIDNAVELTEMASAAFASQGREVVL